MASPNGGRYRLNFGGFTYNGDSNGPHNYGRSKAFPSSKQSRSTTAFTYGRITSSSPTSANASNFSGSRVNGGGHGTTSLRSHFTRGASASSLSPFDST